MRRADRIRKIILEQIKPRDCKINHGRFSDCSNPCYHYNKKTIYLNTIARKTDEELYGPYLSLHSLLHEICHHITWDVSLWSPPAEIIGFGSKERFKRGKRYLCEYKAEKALRRICKKYGWNEILKISNMHLMNSRYHNFDRLSSYYLWGWKYAANRIIREEKI